MLKVIRPEAGEDQQVFECISVLRCPAALRLHSPEGSSGPEGGEDRQVFDPKLLREAREVDAGATSKNPDGFFSSSNCPSCSSSDIEILGKNEHAKSVFWTVFLSLMGLILARIADPVTAQRVLGVLMGTG